MIVFLVPAGGDRFELYSEAPEEPVLAPHRDAGRIRHWAHRASVRWHDMVDTARRGHAEGRIARLRDAIVRRLAESIAEQRTLWSLRKAVDVSLRYPSTIGEPRARDLLNRALGHARVHHGRWLAFDLLLFAASGILFFVPGPNVLAYYLAFRVIGHLNSWRGARQALQRISWTYQADDDLGELASLADLPRDARAARVDAIAARLNLPRLSAFFDRVAA